MSVEQPTQNQPERQMTSEQSPEKQYRRALERKRDTLLAFHTMTVFRKGKSFKDLSPEQIEDYKVLRDDWRAKKELALTSLESLSADRQKELADMGSRLYDVQAKLTLLGGESEQTPLLPGDSDRPSQPEQTDQPAESTGTALELAEAEKNLGIATDRAAILEKAYWEEKVAELKERQEAEVSPDRNPSSGFLLRVRNSFDKAKDTVLGKNRISGTSETIEDRMSPLGLRKEAMDSLSPNSGSESEPQQPEPENQNPEESEPQTRTEEETEKPADVTHGVEREPVKETTWTFLKERAKGLITPFGFREFKQAETLRRRTKEIKGDTEALATLIQQEQNLDLEQAQSEAQQIVETLNNEGVREISALDYERLSRGITDRKKGENDEQIVYVVKSTEDDIYDKLQKYRGEGGQDVLTRENQLAIRADLMGELNKLRNGAYRKDLANYAKLIRRNLDQKWGWRYLWGGIDAALWAAGIAAISTKFLAGKKAVEVAAVAATGVSGAEAAREFVETGMHENVWNTLKNMAETGPGKFTPATEQLKEWSQATLDAIKHYEPEWVESLVEGLKSSRTMPEGFPLKVPAEIMREMQYPGF